MYEFAAGRVETLVAPAVFTVAELARVAPARPVLALGTERSAIEMRS